MTWPWLSITAPIGYNRGIMRWIVAALYQFTGFEDPDGLRAPLLEVCEANGVVGTLLIAPEGINGTIAGSRQAIDAAIAHIRSLPGCADLEWKESAAEDQPFHRMKVRLKREIVTMGVEGVTPAARVGHYIEPEAWNDFIGQDDVVLIDTRNDFEVSIGTFEGAVDPETDSFREFPDWWRANAERFEGKKLAMFCTGGIRCEKATSWLLDEGLTDVFHLKGGILKYLENVPEDESRWQGQCFVFDERVSVGHGLKTGEYDMCRACRCPVSPADKLHPAYRLGVSCPRCINIFSDEDRARFAERQRQVELAEKRGNKHLGVPKPELVNADD
ncbi:MAG: rhodanese-related sulfurtransferase [Pseudomonadota bacterium]